MMATCACALGCQALSEPPDRRAGSFPAPVPVPPSGGVGPIQPGLPPPIESVVRIPTDTRPPAQAETPPPPITGGTLSVSADGLLAVAADPARDIVSVIELQPLALRGTVALRKGDEPGRVVIDPQGRYAYVGLRRGGEVVMVDLADASEHSRRAVCPTPRGMALDEDRGELWVACADGQLVRLPAERGEVVARMVVEPDLRDVMLRGDQVLVTRFKSAELLTLERDGTLVRRDRPARITGFNFAPRPDGSGDDFQVTMQPHVAWRSTLSADGSVVMLHQTSQEDMVDIDTDPTAGGAAYGGGGFDCGGIVETAVTVIMPDGRSFTASIAGAVMAVDVAYDAQQQRYAIAQAGPPDPDAPRPVVEFTDGAGGTLPGPIMEPQFDAGDLLTMSLHGDELLLARSQDEPAQRECHFSEHVGIDAQASAVAFTPDGRLLVQSREPARLTFPEERMAGLLLSDTSIADTGHDLFHRNVGAGIACASCHAEGGDDGHIWNFSRIGMRRTQAVHVGLEGTEPFHWDGDMQDLETLMEHVMVGRMGGVHQAASRVEGLRHWMFSLTPPPPMVDVDDPAAVRGQELFASKEVGCSECHSGPALTNSKSYYVGTGEPGHMLQVPSLHGIGYRTPFMHTGCAETLRDRFDPACGGGDQHGVTSHLQPNEVDDLVAFLRTL